MSVGKKKKKIKELKKVNKSENISKPSKKEMWETFETIRCDFKFAENVLIKFSVDWINVNIS